MFSAGTWGEAHHSLPQTLALTLLVQPTKMCWASGADPTVGDHSQETKDGAWRGGASSWGLTEAESMLGSHDPFPLYLPLLIPITQQRKQEQGGWPYKVFV